MIKILISVLVLMAALPGFARPISEDEAYQLGMDAYVYAYPLILMDNTERVLTNVPKPGEQKAPVNQFSHMRNFPDASDKDVVSPNVDTLFSSAWLDLSKEPVILHIPPSKGRYYLFPIVDAWTNVIASPGTRTLGAKGGDFAIVGPHWAGTVPSGVTTIVSTTDTVWIIGRLYCSGTPSDLEEAHRFQDRLSLAPLSSYGKKYSPPKRVAVDPTIDMKTPPVNQTDSMDAKAFFQRFAQLLKSNPPSKEDTKMVKELARIGINPGQDFDFSSLDKLTAHGLDRAVSSAQSRIQARGKINASPVNGWRYDLRLGRYGTDYDLRAHVAKYDPGATIAEDVVYPYAVTDGDGSLLNGETRYILHFDKTNPPPVNGFWSVTMYTPLHTFVKNPLKRYAIRSPDNLSYNPDGSLDIFIQPDTPGPGRESNWLPAPRTEFNLIMRMYWPKKVVLTKKWKPAPVQRVQIQLGSAAGVGSK